MGVLRNIIMQERNLINGATAAILAPLLEFYQKLIPFLLLGLVLIIVDSRFGIAAARKRGEKIRPSRRWRRSINKLVDYLCWVTLAGVFGFAYSSILGIPILAALMLLLVYGIEISSCYNNYFEAKGIKKKVNIFKLFQRGDVEQCIEDTSEKSNDNEKESI